MQKVIKKNTYHRIFPWSGQFEDVDGSADWTKLMFYKLIFKRKKARTISSFVN